MNKTLIWLWLTAVVMVTGGAMLVYVTVHQILRGSANDPQIQLAMDAALALNKGATPASVVPAGQVDQATSLAPFVIIFNQSVDSGPIKPAAVLATNAIRADDGAVLWPVNSVYHSVSQAEERFTWETASGLRFATVIMPYKHGYVVAARSLKETEARSSQLGVTVLIAWLLGLIVTSAGFALAAQANKTS